MRSKNRKILLNFTRIFFKEFKYINSEDILGVGKYKFFIQYIKSKLIGRKGIYALMPTSSTLICINKLEIKGQLPNSNIIKSLISSRIYLQAINGILLDSSVLIGPDVKIISANHNFLDYQKWDKSPPIVIKKNVWIGANSIILPGVVLGNNCIVGAGSIVTKSFEDNSIIGGNPAQLISKRI